MFSPENMDSFAICSTPVTTANLRSGLPFSAAPSRSLMKSMTNCPDSVPRALWIGLSYSSTRRTTCLP